jgi:hypothetical protein
MQPNDALTAGNFAPTLAVFTGGVRSDSPVPTH